LIKTPTNSKDQAKHQVEELIEKCHQPKNPTMKESQTTVWKGKECILYD